MYKGMAGSWQQPLVSPLPGFSALVQFLHTESELVGRPSQKWWGSVGFASVGWNRYCWFCLPLLGSENVQASQWRFSQVEAARGPPKITEH